VNSKCGEEHTNLQRRNELRESNEKKVQVEEELELFVEYDWEESEHVVFLVPHDIGRVIVLQLLYE
jgi:hypothetical protein